MEGKKWNGSYGTVKREGDGGGSGGREMKEPRSKVARREQDG